MNKYSQMNFNVHLFAPTRAQRIHHNLFRWITFAYLEPENKNKN